MGTASGRTGRRSMLSLEPAISVSAGGHTHIRLMNRNLTRYGFHVGMARCGCGRGLVGMWCVYGRSLVCGRVCMWPGLGVTCGSGLVWACVA